MKAKNVAALFVETNGIYFNMPDVDPWDETRDAREYEGPWPVVAHPPCHLWVNLAHVNYKRYGGAHNRPGNDGGCFAAALSAVRTFGGVLEHPAFSNAWSKYKLPRPDPGTWTRGLFVHGIREWEWTCEVWQSAYGHKARKRTWLYYVGTTPPEMRWKRKPGTHQCGWFDRIKPTLNKKEANRTPKAFRDALVELARTSIL